MMIHSNNLIKCLSAVIVWLLGMPIVAQNIQVNFASNRDAIGTEGAVVRVPILLDTVHTNNMVGENIIALNLTFSHSAQLIPQGFDFAGGLIQSWSNSTTIRGNNQFTITAAGVSPIALDSGLLFYVDFLLGDVASESNPTFTLVASIEAKNYFNEGGYDFSMDYGQIKIKPMLQLSVSSSPNRIAVGDSTRIYTSGGTAPHTYTLVDPTFGAIVSDEYFLADRHGFAVINVEDSNGLQGSTTVEVRPFSLKPVGPEGSVFPGENFEIAIIASDVSQLNVISGDFDFTLSNVENVRFKSIISKSTLLEGASIESSKNTATSYSIAFARPTVLSVGDTLMKLEFESDFDAKNSYSLTITDNDNFIFNDDLMGLSGGSGSVQFINVVAPNLSYPYANYITNEQIQFTGSAGQAPYSWSASDETIGTIDENGLLTLLKGGDITITVIDNLGISNSTDVFIYDARVDILDHTVPEESQYNLPVEITELAADRGFSAFSFEITYDPNFVDFVELGQTGTLLEGFSIAQNQIAANKVKVVGASQDSRTSAGILTNLTFDLLPSFTQGQTTSISLSEITFNEGEPAVIAVAGTLKVGIAPTTGDTDISIKEDFSYTIRSTDIVYNHALADKPLISLRIASLPAVGALTYFSSPVSLNQAIQVSSFDNFKYQPAANESGIAYDSFQFHVYDGTNYSNGLGTISFDVDAVNDPPVFNVSESFVTVQEDFTTSSIVSLTSNAVPVDEQGEIVTYSISPESVDFADAFFDVNALTITFTSVSDASGSQVFTLTADDGQAVNNTFNKLVTLTVQSVNDAPIFSDQVFTINENLGNGSLVAALLATDKDSQLSFALTAGNTNEAFALSTDGLLTVNDFNALDFETTSIITLSVDVIDEITTVSATITINLNDVDEAVNQSPQISSQSFSIDENSLEGTQVGTVNSFDPDGDALTYSITAGNTNNAFAIDGSTGVLSVANVTGLDFETRPIFSLSVQVSDASLNASAAITVNLNDVDETVNQSPQIVAQSFNVEEGSANGTSVGVVIATDPDGDALTYSITAGNTNNTFAIDGFTGVLSVANVTGLDFETTPSFSLIVEVSDTELAVSAIITVNLINIEDTALSSISSNEFAIKLYPNPAYNKLILDCEASLINQKWKIISLDGREVLVGIFKNNQTEIDISLLMNGLYIMNVGEEFNRHIVKLVKR